MDGLETLAQRYGSNNYEGDFLNYSVLSRGQAEFLLDPLVFNRHHWDNYFAVTRIKIGEDFVMLFADDTVLEGRDHHFANKHSAYQKITKDSLSSLLPTRTHKGDLTQQYIAQYEFPNSDEKRYFLKVSFWYRQNQDPNKN